jgi:hypothetical protein
VDRQWIVLWLQCCIAVAQFFSMFMKLLPLHVHLPPLRAGSISFTDSAV